MQQHELEEMQKQDELTNEQKVRFFGQVIKALGHEVGDKDRDKPTRILVHPRLYEQLVPAYHKFNGTPIRIFTIWLGQEIGVPYGQFVFEFKTDGIIKGN